MSWWQKLRSLFRKPVEALPVLPIKGRITRYGYPNDETPDSLTQAGWGAFNNKLTPMALAISRDIEEEFKAAGIKPLDKVEIFFNRTTSIVRRWEDRTARSYRGKPLEGRFDLYCPKDQLKEFDGVQVVGFRKKA